MGFGVKGIWKVHGIEAAMTVLIFSFSFLFFCLSESEVNESGFVCFNFSFYPLVVFREEMF